MFFTPNSTLMNVDKAVDGSCTESFADQNGVTVLSHSFVAAIQSICWCQLNAVLKSIIAKTN